jgi:hypothetical protein
MTKPVTQKLTKETKCAVRRAYRSINDDMCQNKIRWCSVFFLAGLVAALMATQTLGFVWYVLAGVEFVLLCAMASMAVGAAKRPGRMVHEWALAEHEKITISSLKGKTTDELETLLQYHLTNGNIEAADRISQKLLNMVDGTPDNDPVPLAQPSPIPMQKQIAQKADPGVVLKVPAASANSKLPAWMQDGTNGTATPVGENKTAAEEEPQQQSSLPDWMNS